jgi:hypothetical protein
VRPDLTRRVSVVLHAEKLGLLARVDPGLPGTSKYTGRPGCGAKTIYRSRRPDLSAEELLADARVRLRPQAQTFVQEVPFGRLAGRELGADVQVPSTGVREGCRVRHNLKLHSASEEEVQGRAYSRLIVLLAIGWMLSPDELERFVLSLMPPAVRADWHGTLSARKALDCAAKAR